MGQRRTIRYHFWTTEDEHDAIEEKMRQLGIKNTSAYLRMMAMNGIVVKLDLPELHEMLSLLRRTSNNTNQIAKRLNETGRLYDADIQEIQQKQEQLWEAANAILQKLASIH